MIGKVSKIIAYLLEKAHLSPDILEKSHSPFNFKLWHDKAVHRDALYVNDITKKVKTIVVRSVYQFCSEMVQRGRCDPLKPKMKQTVQVQAYMFIL